MRRVAAELHERTGLPVELVDERYTTAAALRAIREMGGIDRGSEGRRGCARGHVLLQQALRMRR